MLADAPRFPSRFSRSIALPVVLVALLLASLSAPAPAFSAPAQTWRFDPSHSTVAFQTTHVVAKILGRFHRVGGTVVFDPADLKGSRVDLTIDVASIDTGDLRRDRNLLADEYLAARRYPQIRFRSTEIRSTSGQGYIAVGDLTIKDVTKRVEIPFTFLGTKPNPMLKNTLTAGFSARTTIDRLDYRIGSEKSLQSGLAGRDVDLLIDLEMLRQK